jgi:uncharacterized membrane protein YgcG
MLKNISSSISFREGSDRRGSGSLQREGALMRKLRWLLIGCALMVLAGCEGGGSPLDAMRRTLDRHPEYSVILNDMSSQGLFFHDYFHRYRIIYPEKGKKTGEGGQESFTQQMTNWVKVNEDVYNKYRDSLGMVILAKRADGTIDTVPQPPLFQFVGDPRFGKWETDDRGNQGWAWLAAGMILSSLIDDVGDSYESRRHVDYRHYQDYRNSRSQGSPYYGSRDSQGRPQYGTQGTVTQKTNTGFFERQQARMADQKESFARKVESRMGRSRPSSSMSSSSSFSRGSSSFGGGRGRR